MILGSFINAVLEFWSPSLLCNKKLFLYELVRQTQKPSSLKVVHYVVMTLFLLLDNRSLAKKIWRFTAIRCRDDSFYDKSNFFVFSPHSKIFFIFHLWIQLSSWISNFTWIFWANRDRSSNKNLRKKNGTQKKKIVNYSPHEK